MIREAGPEDRQAIEALLTRRIDEAMFPLSNLRRHGLGSGGFADTQDHALRLWWVGPESVVAITRSGMLMALLAGDADLFRLRGALSGLAVTGAVGPTQSIRPVLAALHLDGLAMRRDSDEPAFALDLSALRVPDLPGSALVPASGAFRDILTDWRTAYHVEIPGSPADEARQLAEKDIRSYVARGSHRVLVVNGDPVAMTGFNATLPEIVQIGGVYTPPALRNRGYARQVVALHLAESRAAGVTRAVLFAASDPAARAYRAVGFQQTGYSTLVLLSHPTTIAP